jgi:hypothetical protein
VSRARTGAAQCALRQHRGFRPARTCIASLPEPGRRRSLAALGSETQNAAGVAEAAVIAAAAVDARRHFSKQYSCILCGFRAGAVDFSQRNGAPTRSNNRDRIPTSRSLRARSRLRGLAPDRAHDHGMCADGKASLRRRNSHARPASTHCGYQECVMHITAGSTDIGHDPRLWVAATTVPAGLLPVEYGRYQDALSGIPESSRLPGEPSSFRLRSLPSWP